MDIQSNLTVLGTSLSAGGPRALQNVLLQFKVGQIVAATVVKTLPDTGQSQLNIGGNLVKAHSNLALTPGQSLQLEVIESGSLPRLRILEPPPTETLRERVLLGNIALQKSPALLPGQLLALQKTDSGLESIPVKIKTLAQSILRTLPDVRELSTFQGIKRAIAESGIFLESRLASLAPPESESFQHDLKANLLRFAARLELENQVPDKTLQQKEAGETQKGTLDMPKGAHGTHKPIDAPANPSGLEQESRLNQTLAESAKGALSKIVVEQLASLPENQPGKQVWHLEIPYLHGNHAEAAKLTIERETRSQVPEPGHQWSIVLELNPPNLGTLQSKITLQGNQVNAYFRSESEPIRDLIHNHLKLLELQLSNAGLEVGHLASGTGLAREKPIHSQNQRLFDAKA
ncbi:MAG: flagellar hook-length control protein FliK [Gammaproteobacteria bacterium]